MVLRVHPLVSKLKTFSRYPLRLPVNTTLGNVLVKNSSNTFGTQRPLFPLFSIFYIETPFYTFIIWGEIRTKCRFNKGHFEKCYRINPLSVLPPVTEHLFSGSRPHFSVLAITSKRRLVETLIFVPHRTSINLRLTRSR